jgi:hypothetical protein
MATEALWTAMENHDVEGVTDALNAGADVNSRSPADDAPALMSAILQEDYDIVDVLLDAGADVNRRADEGGRTSLMLLATGYYGDVTLVKRLLDKGADVLATTTDGETALNAARGPLKAVLREATLKAEQEQERLRKEAAATKAGLVQVSVGKQLPHDITRNVLGPMLGVKPKRFTPQSAKGRKTRARKTKRRRTLRKR